MSHWKWTTEGPWIKEESTDTEYKWQIEAGMLSIAFQGSVSKLDWWQNFSFWVKPYRGMDRLWFAHAGFLKKWKAVEMDIKKIIDAGGFDVIGVSGFSQGAAVATLCHEWIWFHYPSLRNNLFTTVYGSPRVIAFSWKISERFDQLARVDITTDFVTKVPPCIIGYKHVGDREKYDSFYPWYKVVDNHMSYGKLEE